MKKYMILIALFALFTSNATAQIIQSTSAYSEKVRERYVSYRGSLELSYTIGADTYSKTPYHLPQLAFTFLGFQCSPYFYVGLGLGYFMGYGGQKYYGKIKEDELLYLLPYLDFKVNLNKDKKWTPYVSLSIGGFSRLLNEFTVHLNPRFGFARYNESKTKSLSLFAGMSAMICNENQGDLHKIGFQVGLSFDFGGGAALRNSRPK